MTTSESISYNGPEGDVWVTVLAPAHMLVPFSASPHRVSTASGVDTVSTADVASATPKTPEEAAKTADNCPTGLRTWTRPSGQAAHIAHMDTPSGRTALAHMDTPSGRAAPIEPEPTDSPLTHGSLPGTAINTAHALEPDRCEGCANNLIAPAKNLIAPGGISPNPTSSPSPSPSPPYPTEEPLPTRRSARHTQGRHTGYEGHDTLAPAHPH
jgi:hypothetical protein